MSPLELHDGAMGYCDSFCCSSVFNSVVARHNDSIYFRQTQGLTKFDKRLHIPPGQYTAASLAVAVQALLNEYALHGCSYTVNAVGAGTQLVFDANIESNFTARILSTVELEGAFEDWGYGNSYFMEAAYFENIVVFADGGEFIGAGELTRRDPEDAGELLGITDGTERFVFLTRDFVNLMPYRTLYLTSGSVGSANAYSPKGELSQIIKQIIVADSLPGQAILDRLNVTLEPFHMPPSLSSMHFSLRDRKGKVVDCRGRSISFTLVIPEKGLVAFKKSLNQITTAEQAEPLELEPEQDFTQPIELEPEQDVTEEPLEPVELDPDELAEIEREVLEEELLASSEEELPKPKRVRIKAEPKAVPKPKAEPKRRGRPPGSRNIRPPPLAPPPQHDPLEAIMTSMRERRQAHQEKRHLFFQSFLP